MDIFERFSRILDNYAFHQVGCMFIATEQQYRDGEDEHQMHRRVVRRRCGVHVERLG